MSRDAIRRSDERGEKEGHGEIETEHPDGLRAQDPDYVGTLKGVGQIYQQTFIDTYTRLVSTSSFSQTGQRSIIQEKRLASSADSVYFFPVS